MITRRTFFSITIIMVVILFLFQFTGIAKDTWNDYKTNTYSADTSKMPKKDDVYTQLSYNDDSLKTREFAVYIGPNEDSIWKIMKEWALYAKMSMFCYETLEEYDDTLNGYMLPEMIIVDSSCAYMSKEVERLHHYTMLGINIVYRNLPDGEWIMSSDGLKKLLGINGLIDPDTDVRGYHLFEGLILGGEVRYMALDEESEKRQDMTLHLPWFVLSGGTKVYMKGIMEDETIKAENYPPAIWRHSYNNAYVFAVNGDFMQDITIIGMLQGMRAETQSNMIYPVVNAQSLIINDYPVLANENSEKMDELFSQSMTAVCKEVIWPSVSSVSAQNNFGITCMFMPEQNYKDDILPNGEDIGYYLKLFRESKFEAGLSSVCTDETKLDEKLEKDDKLFKNAVSGSYPFSSFYAKDMTDEEITGTLLHNPLKAVRAVVTDYDADRGILGYVDEDVTRQSIVADSYRHTYRDNLRMRSIQSALGYSCVTAGMERILYPAKDEETWEKLAKRFTGNLYTYWKPFKMFDPATVSESDSRVRNFLSMDYNYEVDGDVIRLNVLAKEMPVWFIFRTNNRVVDEVEGGECTDIEKDTYLIRADEKNVTIKLKEASERYYYE